MVELFHWKLSSDEKKIKQKKTGIKVYFRIRRNFNICHD